MRNVFTQHDFTGIIFNKKTKYLPFLLILVLILVLSGILGLNNEAFAQEATTAGTADKRADYQRDKITVTAQKQEENVQEVPVSMTVLNSVAIEDAKIESMLGLAAFIPNFFIVEAGNSGNNAPTTRGIYAPAESYTVTTGLFVDGVPILNPMGFETGFIDIERIEFLRGPQGTLYGKGAEAGVINIITRQPGNVFTGKVSVDGGRWLSSEADDWLARTSFYLNGPIVHDKFFFGLSGRYEHKDGYIQNTHTDEPHNDRNNWLGKANLRWQPTDKLDMSLVVSHMENNDEAGQQGLSKSGAAMFGAPAPDNRTTACNLTGQYYDTKQDLQALKIDYDLTDDLSITSITTNLQTKVDMRQDFDFTAYTLSHVDASFKNRRTSQELRLAYAKGRLKWLLGAYYDTDEIDSERNTTSMLPSWQWVTHRIINGDSYAVFAQLTYPFTQKLSLTAGARYEVSDKDFEDKLVGVNRNGSWNDFSPKIALEYAFTPAVMAYVSAAKGYRPGGFNELAESEQYYSYDPETLWSYELGMKTAFLDNKLIINGAVFYMQIEDMQVTQETKTGMAHLVNAAEATSQGFELDLSYNPLKGLIFVVGFGYTDIEFDKFSDAAGDYAGNKGPWSPEYNFNLSGQYRHPDGWFARADLIGYGKIYFDKTNKYSRDPFETINLKIGYEGNHFDVYLYGKNILDEQYDADGVWGGIGILYSEPGEVGLQLNYRF